MLMMIMNNKIIIFSHLSRIRVVGGDFVDFFLSCYFQKENRLAPLTLALLTRIIVYIHIYIYLFIFFSSKVFCCCCWFYAQSLCIIIYVVAVCSLYVAQELYRGSLTKDTVWSVSRYTFKMNYNLPLLFPVLWVIPWQLHNSRIYCT